MTADPQTILHRIVAEKVSYDLQGNRREVTGAISLVEAELIRQLIVDRDLSTCLETGVAYGASTIAICAALSTIEARGKTVRHYGVDNCQTSVFGGAALAALKECGLDRLFEMCEGPGHLILPELIKRGLKVDFAFIDGMHTFDYTMLDIFFADKMLKPGGILCLHDMHLPSKRQAARYLMRYRKYSLMSGAVRRVRERVGTAIHELRGLNARGAWASLAASESMIVARKLASFEPEWDFQARI